MPKSMTGYGQYLSAREGRTMRAECRSVNHRYLDLSIRLPSGMNQLEGLVRELAQEEVTRGRLEIRLTDESGKVQGRDLVMDESLAAAYLGQLARLESMTGKAAQDPTGLLAAQNGIFFLVDKEEDQDLLEGQVKEAVTGALSLLNESRAREGDRLALDLLDKSRELEGLVGRLAERAPQVPLLYREKLLSRAEELFQEDRPEWYSDQRLFAETALFADRASIDEELTRLKAHLHSLKDLLEAEGPVGRQLDFLLQEIFREVNTVASKANDLDLTQIAVEAKTLLEKIREQVQNFE